MSKFKEAAASAKPDDDAHDILSIVLTSAPLRPKSSSNDPTPLSKRAAKRVSAHSCPCFDLGFFHTFVPLTRVTPVVDRQVREDEN